MRSTRTQGIGEATYRLWHRSRRLAALPTGGWCLRNGREITFCQIGIDRVVHTAIFRIAAPSPRTTLALYHCVQFGKTILWVSADLIAFYMLAYVCHLAPGKVALVITGSLLCHALSDLVVGRWLARRRMSSRYLAIVIGVAVPIASAAFVLSLLVAPRMSWVALGLMMLSRSAYAVFDIPHQVLASRLMRLGSSPLRIIGVRSVVGQVAAAVLGFALAPVLGPAMTANDLSVVIVTTGVISALFSAPVALLVARYWNATQHTIVPVRPVTNRSRHAILIVMVGMLTTNVLVAATSKFILGAVTPGLALAILSLGRIGASIPWSRKGHASVPDGHLVTMGGILLATLSSLAVAPGAFSLLAFGVASSRMNVLVWAWLSGATDDGAVFGGAGMLSKVGLALSVPMAAAHVR